MAQKAFEFRAPPRILFGPGVSQRVGEVARDLGCRRALVVTGPVLAKTGYPGQVVDSLSSAGLTAAIFAEIDAEPTVRHVEQGLAALKENECDLVVALGGGSPMDAAKAIAVMAANPGSIADYAGTEKIKGGRLPLIAISTTAGTGSEVTRFAVITDEATNVKMLINSTVLIPDAAVDDPLLTVSMPPRVTASTGMDALTHAIESYISRHSQPLSDTLALSAIRRIAAHLRRAWAEPENLEARTEMMLGALEAGLSFGNSSVALVHGMARPLGAYFHIPHGLANAMLLPHVMAYSAAGAPERFRDIAAAMGERVEGLTPLQAAWRAVEAVRELCADLGVPTLSEAGVDEEELLRLAPTMAKDALASGSPANNPRLASEEDIVELYKRAL